MPQQNKLTRAVLHQVQDHLRCGNINKAKSLGFNEEELKVIRKLSSFQIDNIAASGLSVVRVEIDHPMFITLISRINDDEDREKQIDELLFLGASGEMMSEFFALSSIEVATRRSLLGIVSKKGRRVALYNNEKVGAEIYHAWVEKAKDPKCRHDLDALVYIAKNFNYGLAEIWGLVKSWCD